MKIRTGNIFESLDEVYDYYNGDIVKIVNLQQFLFYAGACGIQADWVDRSPYDGKLIAYYGRIRTKDCSEKWKATTPDVNKRNGK